ncbi:MAG: aminotransferase class I/II-fold pyridoxal phosphate-dependent enzyme [Nevskiales bacterium]
MLSVRRPPPPNPLPQGEGETNLEERLSVELKRIRAADLYRVRRVVEGTHGARITVGGKASINFCSNDYLGLASDPRVAEAGRKALATTGTGSGAAALVSGYNREHQALEEELAAFVQRPRALLFSSGWAANLGVLRALASKNDVLIADELNHASLIDGGRLSGARYVRVAHGDVMAFRSAIEEIFPLPPGSSPGQALREGARGRGENLDGLPPPSIPPLKGKGNMKLVATDSVFSMDGDLAPLPELAALCQQYNAALMVDDAHGFGVLGDNGRGTQEHFGLSPDIYVATLGKALGCAGAFVAGSENLIEYLIQRARSWVFSTAPPPAVAAAARAALRIVQTEPERRTRLFELLRRFRSGCAQLGIPLSKSETPIQPLILGDESRALAFSQHLFERGYWVAAIRPPTVPPGTARLRITLSATHSEQQVDGLLNALAECWQ